MFVALLRLLSLYMFTLKGFSQIKVFLMHIDACKSYCITLRATLHRSAQAWSVLNGLTFIYYCIRTSMYSNV